MVYKIALNASLSELTTLRLKFEYIFDNEKLFDEITRKNILLALTELFVNVVKHGYLEDESLIEFNVDRIENGLEITMYEQGKSYDPFDVPLPDITLLPENGYGVFLVKSLMDSFEYRPKNDESVFNITTIRKSEFNDEEKTC